MEIDEGGLWVSFRGEKAVDAPNLFCSRAICNEMGRKSFIFLAGF